MRVSTHGTQLCWSPSDAAWVAGDKGKLGLGQDTCHQTVSSVCTLTGLRGVRGGGGKPPLHGQVTVFAGQSSSLAQCRPTGTAEAALPVPASAAGVSAGAKPRRRGQAGPVLLSQHVQHSESCRGPWQANPNAPILPHRPHAWSPTPSPSLPKPRANPRRAAQLRSAGLPARTPVVPPRVQEHFVLPQTGELSFSFM